MKKYRLRVMRTKSLLWLLLMLIVSMAMVGIGGASSTTLSVEPPSIINEALGIGSTFTVDIVVTDVIDLQGYDFKLGYDTTILNATESTVGDFFPEVKVWSNVINEVEGYAWVVVTTPLGGEPVDGSGTLVTINFTVLELGESDLDFLETGLYDLNAVEIPHDVVDGFFTNIEVHDIAVTSVTVSPSTVTVGESVSITVTVENEGDFSETFNVTAYYDETAIGTQTVTNLVSGISETLTFSWATADVSLDTYTVKAEASVVAGETEIADNTRTDGTVTITLLPTPDHDIAVTSVTVSPSTVTVGESVSITVTVENEGDFSETFNVTAYYDETTIGTQTVTNLVSGISETLTFSWATADVSLDTYTVKAEASVVAGETEIADNTRTDGTVTVKEAPAPDILLYVVAGIVIAIVAAAILVYVLRVRKPKPT